jgi:phosphinothricin acetyltransferase
LVAAGDDDVAGWASLSPWAPHGAYAATAEHSVFVDRDYRGRGIGKALLGGIVAEAQTGGFHVLVGRITDGDEVSRRLHTALGFEDVGLMREVGYKQGRRLDVWIVQRILRTLRSLR